MSDLNWRWRWLDKKNGKYRVCLPLVPQRRDTVEVTIEATYRLFGRRESRTTQLLQMETFPRKPFVCVRIPDAMFPYEERFDILHWVIRIDPEHAVFPDDFSSCSDPDRCVVSFPPFSESLYYVPRHLEKGMAGELSGIRSHLSPDMEHGTLVHSLTRNIANRSKKHVFELFSRPSVKESVTKRFDLSDVINLLLTEDSFRCVYEHRIDVHVLRDLLNSEADVCDAFVLIPVFDENGGWMSCDGVIFATRDTHDRDVLMFVNTSLEWRVASKLSGMSGKNSQMEVIWGSPDDLYQVLEGSDFFQLGVVAVFHKGDRMPRKESTQLPSSCSMSEATANSLHEHSMDISSGSQAVDIDPFAKPLFPPCSSSSATSSSEHYVMHDIDPPSSPILVDDPLYEILPSPMPPEDLHASPHSPPLEVHSPDRSPDRSPDPDPPTPDPDPPSPDPDPPSAHSGTSSHISERLSQDDLPRGNVSDATSIKFETPKECMMCVILSLCLTFLSCDPIELELSLQNTCETIRKQGSFGHKEERNVFYTLTMSTNRFLSFRLLDVIYFNRRDNECPDYGDLVDSIVGNALLSQESLIHVFETYDGTFAAACFNRHSNTFMMIQSTSDDANEADKFCIHVDVVDPGVAANDVLMEWEMLFPALKTFIMLIFDESLSH
eukprot:TRINITY_DN846_c0_g1_i1.p1 TRINITY_DN846_c0_g1~~TRINITY_DN846_c0_g1_i1.p1  ORF type:complete len:663 (-),score=149.10 TRINITY_DN846_c0_g1_i1:187-2175(-)